MSGVSLLDMFDETIQTIPQMLYNNQFYAGDLPATRFLEEGQIKSLSYKELVYRVECIAIGLMKLGLEPLDRVGIIGSVSNRWIWTDLGVVTAGGTTVNFPEQSSCDELMTLSEDSAINALVVPDSSSLREIQLRIQNDDVIHYIICMEKGYKGNGINVLGLGELFHMGRLSYDHLMPLLKERIECIHPSNIASIVYLTAKTGKNQSVLYSHKKILSTCTQAIRYLERLARSTRNDDLRRISSMPVHQIMGKMNHYIWPMIVGACLDLADPENAVKSPSEVKI